MNTVITVTLNPALDQTVRVANLTPGDVNRAESLEFNAGGKGVNVAGCLADYGVATIVTGLLGAEDSAAFDTLFAAKRIDDRFVRVPGRTRINVKLVDTARHETTDINLATTPPAPACVEALERRIAELARPGRWCVLAGSLPPGVDPSFYRRMTRVLHDAGVHVALDTSGAPLTEALAATDARDLPDLVKPNQAELEALLGRALDDDEAIIAAACELVARGIRYVVVSLGGRGAIGVMASQPSAGLPAVSRVVPRVVPPQSGATDAASRAAPPVFQIFRATPPRVPVASTVGAGDAFVAGLIASLIEARTWDDAGRQATAFAAAKLARVGPHLPDHATLATLAARVEVKTFTLSAADGVVQP